MVLLSLPRLSPAVPSLIERAAGAREMGPGEAVNSRVSQG